MSVLVVGTVAFDTIETSRGAHARQLGGSAMYASMSAALFGPAQLSAVIGDDFDEAHVRTMERRGVDLRGLERLPGKTFYWAGRYTDDFSARETLATELNVFADYTPNLPPELRNPEILLLGNIHPELQAAALEQADGARLVAADTMDLWIESAREPLLRLLRRVDMLILNDEEARLLSGTPHLVKAGRELLKLGPRRVVVKKGEHGVLSFTEEGGFAFPAYPVEDVIDPTGAGDCFAGALLGSLASGGGAADEGAFRRAAVYGTTVASFAVEGYGPEALRGLTRERVEKRRADLLQYVRTPDIS